ncbi:MAG: HAD family hydrolase [Clostridia bacterium]|nr:HAD family hydrolase [Clostridia bacterium]
MKYKLISSDLDGTLLNSKESISEQNSAAMKKLREMGIVIAVNTGRTLYEIPDSVRDNPYIDYYICSNGAAIYSADKKLIYSNYIPKDSFKKVFALLLSYDTSFAVHDDGKSILDEKKATVEFWTDHRASEYAARNFVKFSDVEKDFEKRYADGAEVEMICCYFKHAHELSECTQMLEKIPDIKTAASSNENIEVFSADINKGITMGVLCDMLSVELSEVIAAGDSYNDLTMMNMAGLSLAAGNAMDAVKNQADKVICSCEEHIMRDILNIV